MNKSLVILDANIFITFLSKEPNYQRALALWQSFVESEARIVAPLLLRYEVTSVLYRKARGKLLDKIFAQEALSIFNAMDISWHDNIDLTQRAYELAIFFNRPTTYDAHYLALAEMHNCPFWTGDARLFNAIHEQFPLIRWVGNAP